MAMNIFNIIKYHFIYLKILICFSPYFFSSVLNASSASFLIDLKFKDNDSRGRWLAGKLLITGEIQNSEFEKIAIVWGNNPSNPLKAYRPIIELKINSEKKDIGCR